MKSLVEKLSHIQAKLKAPKSQYNSFGKYNYRNCEDILEAVKPLLNEAGLVMTITDDIEVHGGRVYVKAVVKITDGEFTVENSALARESLDKKGMDDSQITGATSSYARKYALNGMFLIDDTKDADATNTHGKEAPKADASASGASKPTAVTSGAAKPADKPAGSSKFKPKANKPAEPTSGSEDSGGWS